MLTRDQMIEHGEAWIAAWNRRDVEGVVAGFAADAVFRSPLASTVTGSGELRGRDTIRAYWRSALDRVGHLHFRALAMICDETSQTMVVHYEAELDGPPRRACEIFRFGPHGKMSGEALYGHGAQAPAV
ncbi:MAG: nuclear transport factor 2 family protein [Magnetospirillum sp.]|nr:nuclear transport factor 2 family protein [Magnetospirillum sp.]